MTAAKSQPPVLPLELILNVNSSEGLRLILPIGEHRICTDGHDAETLLGDIAQAADIQTGQDRVVDRTRFHAAFEIGIANDTPIVLACEARPSEEIFLVGAKRREPRALVQDKHIVEAMLELIADPALLLAKIIVSFVAGKHTGRADREAGGIACSVQRVVVDIGCGTTGGRIHVFAEDRQHRGIVRPPGEGRRDEDPVVLDGIDLSSRIAHETGQTIEERVVGIDGT
jgi:hypothetical protein